MNPYNELDVPRDADVEQINAAYRRKAHDAHPDAGGDPDTFARLSRAVSILRDPEARDRYDRTGQTDGPSLDHERTATVQVVAQFFCQAMQSATSLEFTDIIAKTKMLIGQAKRELAMQRQQALNDQRTNAGAIERLAFNGDGPDFIRRVLEEQGQAIAGAIEQMNARERVLTAATEIADTYEWRTDQPPQQTQSGFVWVTNTASTTTI